MNLLRPPTDRYCLQPIAFITLLVLFVAIRVCVFVEFSVRIVDSDQPFMWMGAHDILTGQCGEPRYYGQSYNTFLEGLIAAPLLLVGMPVYYAVPLSTLLLFSLPYLFTACFLYFRGQRSAGILVLALVLSMPGGYDVLNSLPRGFVTGLALCTTLVLSVHHPRSLPWIAVNTVLGVAAYFVNPNSVLVVVPMLVWIFMNNYKCSRYYIVSAAALAMAVPLYLIFDLPYRLHPEWIQNPLNYRLSIDFLWDNLSHLNERMAHITPFRAGHALWLCVLFAVLAAATYRVDKKMFAAVCVFIALLLFSFCFGKTLEGTTWVYMSYSRMYLAVPFFLTLLIARLQPLKSVALIASCISLLFGAYKLCTFSSMRTAVMHREDWVGVRLVPLQQALDNISVYKAACDGNHAPFLLVSNDFWLNTFCAYGGAAVFPGYPETEETRLEKRHWVREANAQRVVNRFVFISTNYQLDRVMPKLPDFKIRRLDAYGMMLIDDNRLPMEKFIKVAEAFEKRGEDWRSSLNLSGRR